jgi:hypothetical protein
VSVEEGANEKSSAEEGPVEAGGGGAPEASEGGEEGSAPEGRSGASPEASGEGAPEVRDGFAATAEAFRAGKEARGPRRQAASPRVLFLRRSGHR